MNDSHSKRDVVFVSGVRTPIGVYGGALKTMPVTDLAALTVKEAVKRSAIETSDVDHIVFGNVIPTDSDDIYLARCAGIKAGIPVEVPALTLNRLCGSGLQAIISASQMIMLGDSDVAVAGGAESLSRIPYWSHSLRWGQRIGDTQMVDALVSALSDPFDSGHMGITAENIAKKWDISRQEQDQLSLESHQRALAAIEAGYFKEQILPVEIPNRKGVKVFDTDENPRSDANLAALSQMRPVFDKDGTVTAGNASSLNDAAAAVVVMAGDMAEAKGLKPMARLVDYTFAGVEPKYMGIGPVPALNTLFEKTGLCIDDIDVFELNEAFAAQALGCVMDLGLPRDKVNPNGSGISLGHPLGATGTIITIKAMYELKRTNGRYAAISMCIGGGQGIAAIIENIKD